MAPISLNQLMMVVEKQDMRIAALQGEIEKLKAWSDLNDHYLQEMIEANAASTDRLREVINEMHDADIINHKIRLLEEEEQKPVAQLLKEFVEQNATNEEKEQLYNPQ